MFVTILTVIHIVVCIFLIVIVLLQHGKGADIGATFGGASNTVFGARGAATVLSKITIGSAVLFMVTSMTLAVMATRQTSGSIFTEENATEQTVPGVGAVPEKDVSQETPTEGKGSVPAENSTEGTGSAPVEAPDAKGAETSPAE